MSEPTKQQIDQAERLQKAGICQESDKWMIEMKDGSFQIHVGNLKDWTFNPERGDYELCKRVVGPIPAFKEVVDEIVPLLSEDQWITIDKSGLLIQQGWMGEVGEPFYHESGKDITTAAIEALLLLKGE